MLRDTNHGFAKVAEIRLKYLSKPIIEAERKCAGFNFTALNVKMFHFRWMVSFKFLDGGQKSMHSSTMTWSEPPTSVRTS